jgi:uncharacterized protein YgiM (DUF1202 family)
MAEGSISDGTPMVAKGATEQHPRVVDVSEGPEPGAIIRMAAPWVVLAILLLIVMNIFGQFNAAQDRAEHTVTNDNVAVAPGPSAPSKTASSGAAASAKAPTVVVIMDGVNFRESPKNSSTVIEAMKQGASLTWLATEGNWYRAKDAKGRTGYISANPTLTQKRQP